MSRNVHSIFAAFALCCAARAQVLIDFSHAGYGGGGVTPPHTAVVLTLRPSGGDDTELLQGAIDRVSAMPLHVNGLRGAVLLRPGTFRVQGHITMRAAGVVLRGSKATVIAATGKGRRTLIEMGGTAQPVTESPIQVTDETALAGSRRLTLERVTGLRPGDHIVITRPSTAEWISAIKMRGFPGTYANQRLDWAPGSRNLIWDRTISEVTPESSQITIDAPITTSLERGFGGGTVAKVSGNQFPAHIGIENITLESEVDAANPRDEEHAWIAIVMDRAEDAWVRGVTARHFASSAVRVGPRARRVTVEACSSEQPVSEPAGYRRQSFLVEGQQVLVRDCRSEQGMNDFASGLLAGGPNVFLNDTAVGALGPSGSFESWSSGVLYEHVKIDSAGMRLTNDMTRAEGAGWTAANSVVWNCDATEFSVQGPPGAENLVKQDAEPLYETQLAKRTGAKLTPMAAFADETSVHGPEFHLKKSVPAGAPAVKAVEIVNGRFVVDGKVVWGGQMNDGWWRGQEVPAEALDVGGDALTRFIPGRTGPGLTEDLPALAARMVKEGMPFYNSVPGLWYDRRRDEHSTNSRADTNVWAPFYEMPWARSGKGTAADGLSQFDLTKFNLWYYSRLRAFEELMDRNGLVLYHNIYNTHNTLEIPPHWVDYPWRPANNINNTGLMEPPPIEPGNHIHVTSEVYDTSNPVRRALHRAMILHELDELSGAHNIFFCIGAQFAGPLSFQEFFQDTVAEWEKQNGRNVRVLLATSKDITDAILANPARAKQVAVIDMRYWQYRPNGKLWAPEGGKNLAFREAITHDFSRANGDAPPDTTPYQVYRQVREYTDRFPDKAVVAWHSGAGPIPVLMAGGAQALMRNPSGGHGQGRQIDHSPFDDFVAAQLATTLMKMKPCDGVVESPEQNFCLGDEKRETVLLYSLAGAEIKLLQALRQGVYSLLWFDPRSGRTQAAKSAIPGAVASITKPTPEAWLLLLRANSNR
ncbi:MAG TPA: DUF6298 domain-containing protein [Bryobacteraceae bacterium]|nr:DUF6298 domain-containing protein [Bryobacteraceae bacterium]